MRLGLAAVLCALSLAACPEPAPPGYDPSNPRPLDPSLRKPPPPGSTRPDEPAPPPKLTHDDAPPKPEPKEAPPPPPADLTPPKEDLAAKFSIRLGAGPLLVSVDGDPKSATVREVKGSKDGEASLKTGQLNAKEVTAFLAALDKLEWWKLPPGDAAPAATQLTVKRGDTLRAFSTACPKGARPSACPAGAAEALIRSAVATAKAQPAPATKLLKFKPGGPGKTALAKAHCAERERPGYFTCTLDDGPLDHCTGKGKKFVCFHSPYEAKGVAVSSDVAADEKKKAPAAGQPWAIELAADRCVANQGRWRCDHDTEVAKVSLGKTWLAWPGEGPPLPVKAGYPE